MFDQEVVLYLDCSVVGNARIDRTYPSPSIDNEGIIVISRDIMDQSHFEVGF